MKTIDFKLGTDNVELKAYVLDASDSMPFSKKRPAVLILPGGAYKHCSDREAEPIAMAFLAEGYQAFVLKYSVGEGATFEKALGDADAALGVLRQYANEWHIDPEKIVVCGFSAGGHLAAAIGSKGDNRPAAVVLGYPCVMESMSQILQFPIPSIDKNIAQQSPPTFIFHTCDDNTVPVSNAIMMAYALTKFRVPYEMHIYGSGVHGLSLGRKLTDDGSGKRINPIVSEWFNQCTVWLQNILKL